MKDLGTLQSVEYRVKPITRYVVTKHEKWSNGAGTSECGEFDNADQAWQCGYALCKQMHELVGWPIADDRIQYPRHPNEGQSQEVTV